MRVRIGDYFLKPTGDDGYIISGPAMELTLKAIGVDGSLWQITGMMSDGRRFAGRGALHSAFDVNPPKRQLGYRILLGDRAIVGAEEYPGNHPERFTVAGFELREPRVLMKQGDRALLTYSVTGDPGAIAIVDFA